MVGDMTTSTTQYTHGPRVNPWMPEEGTPYSDKDVAVIERVRENLLDGTFFRNAAASGRSALGYRPVLNRADWSHAMTTLGKMAAQSDAMAQIASQIMGKVNLYGTRPSASAQIYEAAAIALANEYDDIVGRSGPEAGRYSDHHREFSLRERVSLAYWLAEATAPMQDCVPGVGWCVTAIARAEGIHPSPVNFPHLGLGKERERAEAVKEEEARKEAWLAEWRAKQS